MKRWGRIRRSYKLEDVKKTVIGEFLVNDKRKWFRIENDWNRIALSRFLKGGTTKSVQSETIRTKQKGREKITERSVRCD